MASITIFGASDDLIEIEGDIREEINFVADHPFYLACNEGTLIYGEYNDIGLWKFLVLKCGSATSSVVSAHDPDSDNYSDRLTLEGNISWVVFSEIPPMIRPN